MRRAVRRQVTPARRQVRTFVPADKGPDGRNRSAQCSGRVTAAGPLPILTGFPIKLVHLDPFQIRNADEGVKKIDGTVSTAAHHL